MYQAIAAIEVRAWNKTVGALVRNPRTGYYIFEYDPAWQAQGIELAPLTMPLAHASYIFPTLPQATARWLEFAAQAGLAEHEALRLQSHVISL